MSSKEITIETGNPFAVKCGMTTENDPRVMYITAKTWVRPSSDENDNESGINLAMRKIERAVSQMTRRSTIFANRHFFTSSVNTEKMSTKRKKAMTWELFVRQDETDAAKATDNVREFACAVSNRMQEIFNEGSFVLSD